jgi:hypothetical protein
MVAFLAILATVSILYSPAASAHTGTIEQIFAASLAAVPAENLAVSGGAGHYAFSQGRPIRVIKN